jgi:Holliday junction DNA helicase RuvB
MTASLAQDQEAQRRSLLAATAERFGVPLRVVREDERVPVGTALQPVKAQGVKRPEDVRTMVGQTDARLELLEHLTSARMRGEQPGHVLLGGPPGLGKTSLAHAVAHEAGFELVVMSGTATREPQALARKLTRLTEGQILFIDEVHALPKRVATVLFTAMEDGHVEMMASSPKGCSELISVDLAPFTLIAATTETGDLLAPLTERFACDIRLQFYTVDELAEILVNAAIAGGIDTDEEACLNLARRSRGTVRTGLRLLGKARARADTVSDGTVTSELVDDVMLLQGIDPNGYRARELDYLRVLCERYEGGPVGVRNIATTMGLGDKEVENNVEPYLLRTGLLQRGGSGRIALREGFAYLGLPVPANVGW